jgi:hypothetical protein
VQGLELRNPGQPVSCERESCDLSFLAFHDHGSERKQRAAPREGDLYLDTVSGEVYRVEGGVWINQPGGLMGPTGAPGPATIYFGGSVSVGNIVDRSAAAVKTDVEDLDVDAAGRLIDALRPITLRRMIEAGEGATVDLPPFRRVGLAVEDIEGCDSQLAERLVRHGSLDSETGEPTDPDERGWSVPGMLSVAIAELKQVRGRCEQLEQEVAALKKGATSERKARKPRAS